MNVKLLRQVVLDCKRFHQIIQRVKPNATALKIVQLAEMIAICNVDSLREISCTEYFVKLISKLMTIIHIQPL